MVRNTMLNAMPLEIRKDSAYIGSRGDDKMFTKSNASTGYDKEKGKMNWA